MNYTVLVTDDYKGNNGNPVSSEAQNFDTLEEALQAYEDELQETTSEYGISRTVTLWQGDEDYKLKDVIKEDCCLSEVVTDALQVLFAHHQYMNYAYDIKDIREIPPGTTYEDLGYNEDRTFAAWSTTFKDVEELRDAYENGRYPFNKIHSGRAIVEDFLERAESCQ